MSRRRALTDSVAEEMFQEYCLWMSLAPSKLAKKYGISKSTLENYVRHVHKTKRAA